MRMKAAEHPRRRFAGSGASRQTIALLPGLPAAEKTATETRPHSVVIYTNDMRADGLRFLGGHVQTPNLD